MQMLGRNNRLAVHRLCLFGYRWAVVGYCKYSVLEWSCLDKGITH